MPRVPALRYGKPLKDAAVLRIEKDASGFRKMSWKTLGELGVRGHRGPGFPFPLPAIPPLATTPAQAGKFIPLPLNQGFENAELLVAEHHAVVTTHRPAHPEHADFQCNRKRRMVEFGLTNLPGKFRPGCQKRGSPQCIIL
jgi:hypothetical protein